MYDEAEWREKNCQGLVKACPVCGKQAMHNCWHQETDSVCTEWMPVARALGMIRSSILYHSTTIKELLELEASYRQILERQDAKT
jgi:hypothetical protein